MFQFVLEPNISYR